jgi:hypothetical protein
MFAAVLGENSDAHLRGPTGTLSSLSPAQQHVLTGTEFFPRLIAAAFHHGLVVVFSVAAGLSVCGSVRVATARRSLRPRRRAPIQERNPT